MSARVVTARVVTARAVGIALAMALLVGFFSALGACTLVLDSPGALSPNCRFKGADTSCGTCIRDHCAEGLATCCGDANCQGGLDALDQCAGKDDQAACSTVRQDPILGSCVTASCKSVCLGIGKGSCSGSGSSCYCDDLAPSDASTCSETSVGGGVCCASLGWPGSGLTCSCRAFRCKETADGCSCSSGGEGPDLTCNGPHCCLSSSECRCSTTACESYEKPVADCSSARVACADDARVSSCSESVH